MSDLAQLLDDIHQSGPQGRRICCRWFMTNFASWLRALTYKWQRVIWKCWQTRSIYKEEIYEAALKKGGSPLVGLLDKLVLGKSPITTMKTV
jgi:hypothetical protein